MLVATSVGWFVIRAVPAIARGRAPARGLRTAVVHVVDTLLLASGIALVVMAGWRPDAHPWLAVKLLLLVVYIVLAALALRPSYPRRTRTALLVAALAAIGWMVAAAVTKSPWGPFAL